MSMLTKFGVMSSVGLRPLPEKTFFNFMMAYPSNYYMCDCRQYDGNPALISSYVDNWKATALINGFLINRNGNTYCEIVNPDTSIVQIDKTIDYTGTWLSTSRHLFVYSSTTLKCYDNNTWSLKWEKAFNITGYSSISNLKYREGSDYMYCFATRDSDGKEGILKMSFEDLSVVGFCDDVDYLSTAYHHAFEIATHEEYLLYAYNHSNDIESNRYGVEMIRTSDMTRLGGGSKTSSNSRTGFFVFRPDRIELYRSNMINRWVVSDMITELGLGGNYWDRDYYYSFSYNTMHEGDVCPSHSFYVREQGSTNDDEQINGSDYDVRYDATFTELEIVSRFSHFIAECNSISGFHEYYTPCPSLP